ncbi:MAG: NAD(P)-dependent oxidoreductase [Saprospiraceae bacterium]|nr:hydroxyacid dehydrogenase [Lewinella sp.]
MTANKKVMFIDKTDPVLWEALEMQGYQCEDYTGSDRDKVMKDLPGFLGLIVRSRMKLDRELLSRATTLKFIGRSGVGLEHIDLEYAAERDILVLPSPEGSRDTVGEHTIGLLLCLMNHLARADRQVRRGEWIRAGNRATELKGKTVGIIGYGNMGTAFAQRLKGFDVQVMAYDKFKTGYGDENAAAVDLPTLQAEADVVSLHIPFLPENHYFVNDAFLESFAKPIFLVNTARGLVLETEALVRKLKSGKVLGAALDVIEYEEMSFVHLDPKKQPAAFQFLLQSDSVILSPHIAGWSHESERGHALALVEKIAKVAVE